MKRKAHLISDAKPRYWVYLEEVTGITTVVIELIHSYLPLWSQLFLRRLGIQLPKKESTSLERRVLYHNGPGQRVYLSDAESVDRSELPTLWVHKMLSFEPYQWGITHASGHRSRSPISIQPLLRLYFEPKFKRGQHRYADVVSKEKDLWEDWDWIRANNRCSMFDLTNKEIIERMISLIDLDTNEILLDRQSLGCTGHNNPGQNLKCEHVARFTASIRFWGERSDYHTTQFSLQCLECASDLSNLDFKGWYGPNEWTDWDFFFKTFSLDHIVQDKHGPRVASIA